MFKQLFICAQLLLSSNLLRASEKLLIASPHRKSVQEEYIRDFKSYYQEKFSKKIDVEWFDQGGATEDLRFVLSRFKSSKDSATSSLDLFWGGGEQPFYELESKDFLVPYEVEDPQTKKNIPEKLLGIPLKDKTHKWYGSAISAFGIFVNKKMLEKIKAGAKGPQEWLDLTRPEYFDLISNADPRKSSSSVTINQMIIKIYGWDEGWKILTLMAANTRKFLPTSSDPVKSVVSGDAVAAPVITYFAAEKISELGSVNLDLIIPKGKTIINTDPIGILKGAPNLIQAKRFVEYILSLRAQKILVLPKGTPGGPQLSTIARMSVNKLVYTDPASKSLLPKDVINPFALDFSPATLASSEIFKYQSIFNDFIGAVFIDLHKDLKATWKKINEKKLSSNALELLTKPILSEKQMDELALKWNDQIFRNNTINGWQKTMRERFSVIAKM